MTEPTKLQRLAEYYDTHDTSEDIERAALVDEPVDPDPMVSLSLRLPKSLLDWVRAQARTEHTKPTQLIRRWIEEHRSSGKPSLEQRVRGSRTSSNAAPGATPDQSGVLGQAHSSACQGVQMC